MTDNTGGPAAFPDQPESAFPSTFKSLDGECQRHMYGMTLRDYFAAKAMQADMSTYSKDLIYEAPEWFEARAVKWYQVADAMLKTREKNT